MTRIHEIEGIKVETIPIYGEVRFRFWVPSFWFAPNWESDGGLYRGIKEAVAAGKVHICKQGGKS